MTLENDETLYLEVAGLPQEVLLSPQEQSNVIIPVAHQLKTLYQPGERHVAFLVGSPGSGKSTFAAIMENTIHSDIPFQVLPADGFHFPNEYLDSHSTRRDGAQVPLRKIKGAPETFDVQKLINSLDELKKGSALQWPRYDRTLHEPVEDAIKVLPEGVMLIEGNYLLLGVHPWDSLHSYADLTIFLDKPFDKIREDIVWRHMKGKKWSFEQAQQFFDESDGKNAQLIINSQIARPDMLISISAEGKYSGLRN